MRDFSQLVMVHSRIVFRCAAAISHRSPSFAVVHSMPVLRWLSWSFMIGPSFNW